MCIAGLRAINGMHFRNLDSCDAIRRCPYNQGLHVRLAIIFVASVAQGQADALPFLQT